MLLALFKTIFEVLCIVLEQSNVFVSEMMHGMLFCCLLLECLCFELFSKFFTTHLIVNCSAECIRNNKFLPIGIMH